MLTAKKYKRYDQLEDLLKIPPEEIDQPIYFQNATRAFTPIWIAIEHGRRDIIGSLLHKQTDKNKINFTGPIKFAYALGVDALKKGDVSQFIMHLKALILIDESKVTSGKLVQYLDNYLSHLSKAELKAAAPVLLQAMENMGPQYVGVFKQSKYINYLTTAFEGRRDVAQAAFNPEHLRVLTKVGFYHARRQKSVAGGNDLARNFMKQIMEEPGAEKQRILFYQALFVDNLNYAAKLINARTNSNLYIQKGGVCAAFVKYWLFHERLPHQAGAVDQQNLFFHEIMKIASLSHAEIDDMIQSHFGEKKADKPNTINIVQLVKNYATRIDALQGNVQFQGQITQRTMKKSFGFELIDEYGLEKLKTNKPMFAYLRITYKDKGAGHAIGIHMIPKQLPSGQTVMQYKVWDPNDKPKTFKSEAEFVAYLNGLKSNPKYKTLSIIEFSPHEDPALQNKLAVIEAFKQSLAQLKPTRDRDAAAMISCLKLLIHNHDTGVIPMNHAIPLFVFLSERLNGAGQNINLTGLYQVIAQDSLMDPLTLDLNKLPFLHEFIDGALETNPKSVHIVTALFSLGLYDDYHYRRLSKDNQDALLEQAILENKRPMINRFLEMRLRRPWDFPVELALSEMIRHSDNIDCQRTLARLLIGGKKLTPAEYKIFEKKPKSSEMFTNTNPPYRKMLRGMIMQQIMEEINKYQNKKIGKEDEGFLAMLDCALNPANENAKGCYDMLSLRGIFSDKKTEPRKQIIEALVQNNIQLDKEMQGKYTVLAQAIAYQQAHQAAKAHA